MDLGSHKQTIISSILYKIIVQMW